MKYIVTFKEHFKNKKTIKKCSCRNKAEVVKIYGLDEDDIDWYEIEEEKD